MSPGNCAVASPRAFEHATRRRRTPSTALAILRRRPHGAHDGCTSAPAWVMVPRMPAAERSPQPAVVRVGDISAIVTAVVHMLGFQPAESLVAVALRGPRERMHFTLRLDL